MQETTTTAPPKASARRTDKVLVRVPAVGQTELSFVDHPGFARDFVRYSNRRRLRSFVRPSCAVLLTAGPDDVRVPGPNQTDEL